MKLVFDDFAIIYPLGSMPTMGVGGSVQEVFNIFYVTNFRTYIKLVVPLHRDSAETSAALLGMWVATKFSRCGFCHLATTVALLARRVATLL